MMYKFILKPKTEEARIIEAIKEAVCEVLGVDFEKILPGCRRREYVDARRIMYVLAINNLPDTSLEKIGSMLFNDKKQDHSTIIYARDSHVYVYNSDKKYKELTNACIESFEFKTYSIYNNCANF